MATLEEMSPPSLNNYVDHKNSMGSSLPLFSTLSDELFWNKLRNRMDLLAEKRKDEGAKRRSLPDEDTFSLEQKDVDDAERRKKRMKEGDSLLLLRGLDSIASSLSQLTDCLDSALQGATDLSKPTLTEVFCNSDPATAEQEDDHSRPPRKDDEVSDRDILLVKEKPGPGVPPQSGEEKRGKMKDAQNLACAMATKAASLARELKSVKSDLFFMQERCSLLEEENRRLRDGIPKGLRPEEDDLVRLQLEALLAEKSRLANENANLARENQCLHQLVEYHQMTMQDCSASPDQTIIQGMYLDFSSPSPLKEGAAVEEVPPRTPRTDDIGFLYPVDE